MTSLLISSDFQAERHALGNIFFPGMISLEDVFSKLTDGHFFSPDTKKWFVLARDTYVKNGYVSLDDLLHIYPDAMEQINFESSMNFPFTFAILDQHLKTRQFAETVVNAKNKITAAEPFLEEAISELEKINADSGNSKSYTFKNLSARAVDRWQNNCDGRNVIMVDIPRLDKLTIRRGNLVYIIAPPKTGKTWLLCALAVQLMHRNYKTLFISAEMHPDDLYSRIASYIAGVDASRLDYPDTPRRNYEEIGKHIETINDLKGEVVDAVGTTLNGLKSIIGKAALNGYDCIVLDYLQKISDPAAKDLRIATNNISGYLADITKKKKITIFSASQAGRQAQEHGQKKLTETYHGKESGNIEADADVLLALTDSTDYSALSPDADLQITIKCSQRNGLGFICYLLFDPMTGRYRVNEEKYKKEVKK